MSGMAIRLGLAFLLGASLLMVDGCTRIRPAAGEEAAPMGVTYARGELRARENVPLDQAWNASMSTLKYYNYKAVTLRKDERQGDVQAHRARDGAEVEIRLNQLESGSTEFRIRAGEAGNETRSRDIYNRILVKLGKPPVGVAQKKADQSIKRKVTGVEAPVVEGTAKSHKRVQGVVTAPGDTGMVPDPESSTGASTPAQH